MTVSVALAVAVAVAVVLRVTMAMLVRAGGSLLTHPLHLPESPPAGRLLPCVQQRGGPGLPRVWSQAPGVRRALRRSRKRGRLGKMDMLVVMSDGCEQFSHVMVIQAIKGVTPG